MANKPRWEAKYEKMLNQEPVSEKIAKLKEEIENTKRNEVGTFKTKEEYQDALREAKLKLPEQEAQLQDYENYEKNKTKIANILAYRKELEKQLENNPVVKEIEKNSKILEEQKKRANELMAKMQKSGIDENEHNELQEDLDITQAVIRNLNERDKILQADPANKEKEMCERRIAKCNLIAANLLKGKNLEDIQIKIEPSNKVFKQQKTTKKQEQETEKQEKAPKEGELSDPEIIDDEQENAKTNYPAKLEDFATRHPRLARIAGFFKNGFSSIKNRIARLFARKGEAQAETENATPENTSNVEPEVENKTEQKVEEKTEQEPKLSDQEMEEVREIIKSSREAKKAETKELRENRLLSYITEYGKEDGEKAFRDSLKVELTEKQKEIKEQELKAKQKAMEARQDGATYQKDDEQGR